jgi:hypothetical protein
MAKARPRTGEKRRSKLPLKIDKLIAVQPTVREAILYLRNTVGRTWPEIEEQSARAFSEKWATDLGGFVNWESLPTHVLEQFPEMRLPHSNLHRWYDLRVSQVVAEVQARSEQARELAASFAKSVVKGGDEAVMNAARDQLMSLLAENTLEDKRVLAAKGLIALATAMQRSRTNSVRERLVAVEERRVVQLERDAELKRRRFTKEMDAAEKKITKGESVTADDINRIRERVFGIGPGPVPIAAH